VQAGREQERALPAGRQKRLELRQVFDIIEDEQPALMPIEPAQHGSHDFALILLVEAFRQGEQVGQGDKTGDQRGRRLGLNP
jgi:hypothetical protein